MKEKTTTKVHCMRPPQERKFNYKTWAWHDYEI